MGINRRSFLTSTFTAGISAPYVLRYPRPVHAAARPNIVLIVADDLGYGDLSSFGAPDIRTPVIDRIAQKGVRFTNFYSNAPECTPTRTALLTGRYQQRVGGLECALGVGNVGRYDDAIRLRETNDLGLPASIPTLPQLLKAAGYNTACCGKWHLGYETKFHPLRHGFDHYFGIMGGGADYFSHTEASGWHVLFEGERRVRRDGYLTDLFTDDAIRFIDQQTIDTPFFLYVPYNAPHSPYQAIDDKTDYLLTDEDWNQGTRETFGKMVNYMDRRIGDILHALESKEMMENTMIVFMSDNGANRKGRNHPFSGFKSSLFEGGIHVPCVARWDGVLNAGVESSQVCISMDFTRSIMNAVGAEMPEPYGYDGMDILKHVQDEKADEDRTLFWRARRGDRTWKAVRDGDMKYVYRTDASGTEEYLFNLRKDVSEQNDLKSKDTQTFRGLKQILTDWEDEVKVMR